MTPKLVLLLTVLVSSSAARILAVNQITLETIMSSSLFGRINLLLNSDSFAARLTGIRLVASITSPPMARPTRAWITRRRVEL